MKNKALLALLISLIAMIPLKLFSNENFSEDQCLSDIIKKTESIRKNGEQFNFVIEKDAKKLLVFKLHADNEIDLDETPSASMKIDRCPYNSAKDLYNFYEEEIKRYINEQILLANPVKREQNGNIIIFKSINLSLTLGGQLDQFAVVEPQFDNFTEVERKKEMIDFDKSSEELIKATIDIKELFIEYELNEAQYKEAASELIKFVKDKWKEIFEDRCKQKDYQATLEKCQKKQNIISNFKKDNLPTLKYIEIFKNNVLKIESCFNSEGFNEENCNTNKKIKSESSSIYFEKLISQSEEKENYFRCKNKSI